MSASERQSFELDHSVYKGARGFVTGASNICMRVLSVMSGARNVRMGVFSFMSGARNVRMGVFSFMSGAFSLNGRVNFNPFRTGAWQIDETN